VQWMHPERARPVRRGVRRVKMDEGSDCNSAGVVSNSLSTVGYFSLRDWLRYSLLTVCCLIIRSKEEIAAFLDAMRCYFTRNLFELLSWLFMLCRNCIFIVLLDILWRQYIILLFL
jgi:hypothetical protein